MGPAAAAAVSACANIMTTNWKQLCDSFGWPRRLMRIGLNRQRFACVRALLWRYCYVRHVCVIIYLQDVCALVLFEQIQGDSGWRASSGGCNNENTHGRRTKTVSSVGSDV